VGITISTSWRTQRVILNQWGIGSKWWDIRSRRWSQPEAGIPLTSESSVESLWLCSSKKYVESFLGCYRNSKVYTHYKSTVLGNQPMWPSVKQAMTTPPGFDFSRRGDGQIFVTRGHTAGGFDGHGAFTAWGPVMDRHGIIMGSFGSYDHMGYVWILNGY
jgi:hypothetical protein